MIVFRVSGFIMDPVIFTFPKILYTSDVMDALNIVKVAVRSGSADYFDNVMTKFIVNNRTDK